MYIPMNLYHGPVLACGWWFKQTWTFIIYIKKLSYKFWLFWFSDSWKDFLSTLPYVYYFLLIKKDMAFHLNKFPLPMDAFVKFGPYWPSSYWEEI